MNAFATNFLALYGIMAALLALGVWGAWVSSANTNDAKETK